MTRPSATAIDTTAQTWGPRILAGLADGAEMRIPLAVFHSPALRRDLERALADRGQRPRWTDAKSSLDDAGRPVRLVPTTTFVMPSAVDDGWDAEA